MGTPTFQVCVCDHLREDNDRSYSCILHVVEAITPRWTFEGGMREAAREALALL
jgi:hypothetical protein